MGRALADSLPGSSKFGIAGDFKGLANSSAAKCKLASHSMFAKLMRFLGSCGESARFLSYAAVHRWSKRIRRVIAARG